MLARSWAVSRTKVRSIGAAAALLLLAPTSRAEWSDNLTLWVVLAGLNVGMTQRHDDGSPHIGADVSLPLTTGLAWAGPYTDVLYDGDFRWTIGPEFGLLFFGVDGGYLLEQTESGTGSGYVIRPTLTFPIPIRKERGTRAVDGLLVLTAYWRYGKNVRFDSDYSEVGLLWKFPLGAL